MPPPAKPLPEARPMPAEVTPLTPITPAEPGTLADQAYARLKQMIFDFTLMPGNRCSESELAQSLSVSRTPLRQAA